METTVDVEVCSFCGVEAPPDALHTPHEFGCDRKEGCVCDLRACPACCPRCNEGAFYMSQCRGCRSRVIWMRTVHGMPVPVDAEDMGGWDAPATVDDGDLRSTGTRTTSGRGATIPVVDFVRPGQGRWRCHWRACRPAAAWRRRH